MTERPPKKEERLKDIAPLVLPVEGVGDAAAEVPDEAEAWDCETVEKPLAVGVDALGLAPEEAGSDVTLAAAVAESPSPVSCTSNGLTVSVATKVVVVPSATPTTVHAAVSPLIAQSSWKLRPPSGLS